MAEWKNITSSNEMTDFYSSILDRLRKVAKEHGYALGLHGSMSRDFDLIAVPWVNLYSDKDTLAKDLQKEACGFVSRKFEWEKKPNNRYATCFPICFIDYTQMKDERNGLCHIDLSVIEFGEK